MAVDKEKSKKGKGKKDKKGGKKDKKGKKGKKDKDLTANIPMEALVEELIQTGILQKVLHLHLILLNNGSGSHRPPD